MFNEIYQYINDNKLHDEVLKIANKTNNIKMAMIIIYHKIPLTDNIIKLSEQLNKVEEVQYKRFIEYCKEEI